MRHLRTSLAFVIFIGLGCAQQATTPAPAPAPASVVLPSDTRLLGLWHGQIDPVNGIVDFTPLRTANATDALEIVDITNYLTESPCTDCVKLDSFRFTPEGEVVLSIGIRHPFAAGDAGLPISGSNRGDLHVFNVEGTLVLDGDGTNFSGIGTVSGPSVLRNADGYSAYLDPVLDPLFPTSATIHPYKLHFADYSGGSFDPFTPTGFTSVTTPPPGGNLVMAMGADYDFRDYVLDLNSGPIDFIYAVGCTYGVASTSRFARFDPEYRVPQHLKKAASEIIITELSNDLIESDPASTALLQVGVVDRSHGVAEGPGLDQMAFNSSVSSVTLELPGILNAPLTQTGAGATGGTGYDPLNALTFDFPLTNEASALEGSYLGLVKVLDSYPVTQNALPSLSGQDGLARSTTPNPLQGLYGLDEIATYQHFTIQVSEFTNPDPIPNWPSFQGDLGNTGSPGLMGPNGSFSTPSWSSGCADWMCYGNPLPVFLDDTTAYFSNTGDGGSLPSQAVDLATRTVKWTRLYNDLPQNWLNTKGISITPNGTFVLTHENQTGHLYGLRGIDGSEAWRIEGWGHMSADSFAGLDLDGNFIIASSDPIPAVPEGPYGWYSLNPETGAQNWYHATPDPYYPVPATGADGTIYACYRRSNLTLLAMNPSDGSTKWEVMDLGEHRGNALTVHPDGGIIVHTIPGLYLFDDMGTSAVQRWTQPYPCPFFSSVGIGQNDDIYVVDYDGILRRVSPADGTTLAMSSGWDDGVGARMAIDEQGTIYFRVRRAAENESWLYAANPDCTQKWGYYAGAWIGAVGLVAAPAIGIDGTLYSSQRNLGLIAFTDNP